MHHATAAVHNLALAGTEQEVKQDVEGGADKQQDGEQDVEQDVEQLDLEQQDVEHNREPAAETHDHRHNPAVQLI